jgi:hypothetical protein
LLERYVGRIIEFPSGQRERGRDPKGAGTDVRNIQDGRLRIVYLNITEI